MLNATNMLRRVWLRLSDKAACVVRRLLLPQQDDDDNDLPCLQVHKEASRALRSNPTVTKPDAASPFDNEKSPGVACEVQPKRRGTLVSSRPDDRQRSTRAQG
jgi:hypothetical protein